MNAMLAFTILAAFNQSAPPMSSADCIESGDGCAAASVRTCEIFQQDREMLLADVPREEIGCPNPVPVPPNSDSIFIHVDADLGDSLWEELVESNPTHAIAVLALTQQSAVGQMPSDLNRFSLVMPGKPTPEFVRRARSGRLGGPDKAMELLVTLPNASGIDVRARAIPLSADEMALTFTTLLLQGNVAQPIESRTYLLRRTEDPDRSMLVAPNGKYVEWYRISWESSSGSAR